MANCTPVRLRAQSPKLWVRGFESRPLGHHRGTRRSGWLYPLEATEDRVSGLIVKYLLPEQRFFDVGVGKDTASVVAGIAGSVVGSVSV